MLIIRRSKPAGNFTILPNELLRDDRLSYCARGVLGELLSRLDGWETNADALSERARRHRDGKGEGRRAMRAAFAELEAAGYMIRKRERIARGKVGGGNFVTVLEVYDTPQNGGTGCGTSIDGTSIGGTSMSGTSSRSTEAGSTDQEDGGKKTLSPPLIPEQRTAESAPTSERETTATPKDKPTNSSSSSGSSTTAQRIIRTAAVLTPEEEPAFIAWATTTHQPRGGGWWHKVRDNGDLPGLVADWRAESAPQAPTGRPMPPWCRDPDCSEIDRMRDREDANGYSVVVRCKDCHPGVAPTWASSSPRQDTASHNAGVLARYRARAGGHQPYRDPSDQSVYDLGFDGRPLPDLTADRHPHTA